MVEMADNSWKWMFERVFICHYNSQKSVNIALLKKTIYFFQKYQGESYIVLFHISQFVCFLFARDIRPVNDTRAYHTVVWDVSAKYTVCEL